MANSGYMFPVTEVKIKYMKSLRFGDICRAKAILVEYENMIQMKFELYNAENGELTTKGNVNQMCIKADTKESQFVCPKCFTEKVEALLK
jgi:acyl-CoA thioester hydrolase